MSDVLQSKVTSATGAANRPRYPFAAASGTTVEATVDANAGRATDRSADRSADRSIDRSVDPAASPVAGPTAQPFRIVLAPMEGVIDAPMRARLTSLGGYDRCVTEFVRVCELLLPERVFLRLCPELARDGHTPAGTPVYVQLLGSDPGALAANARRAAALGAPGIDLNFGCPAKTVNRSEGGSVLLREPPRVAAIVRAVRDALPATLPLTVKIRLGYADAERLEEIAHGVRAGGADELAIHARTKFDGYRPPARWERVRAVTGGADVDDARVIAACAGTVGANGTDAGGTDVGDTTTINGEIWSVRDGIEARRASGCRHVMLGRGALAAPDLARRIRLGDASLAPLPWPELVDVVQAQFHSSDAGSPRHVGNRTKQWLAYLRRTYPEAAGLFARLRTHHDIGAIDAAFAAHRLAAHDAAPAARTA